MTKRHRKPARPQGPHAFWFHLLCDESGQDLIEYALVAAIVGLGAIASLKGLSTKIGTSFSSVSSTLTSSV
jgi:pilus assembly protein Flp/PilA